MCVRVCSREREREKFPGVSGTKHGLPSLLKVKAVEKSFSFFFSQHGHKLSFTFFTV